MTCIRSIGAGPAPSIAVTCGAVAAAADLKVSSARLGVTVLRELAAQFERDTGHYLAVTEIYGPEFMKPLNAGAPLDADLSSAH